MPIFLIHHLQGCLPLKRCASCRAADFLRSKLGTPDFEKLIAIASEVNAELKPDGCSQRKSQTRIADLELTERARSDLIEKANIKTVAQLEQWTEPELLAVEGFGGRKSLNEIKMVLAQMGRDLKAKK